MERLRPALGLIVMCLGVLLVVMSMALVKHLQALNPSFTVVELLLLR